MRVASDSRRRLSWFVAAVVLAPLIAVEPVFARSATDLFVGSSGPVQYALVFLLAAIPWFEILLVIPIAVGLGMDAVSVAVFAFLGNVLPVYAILVSHERVRTWWQARRRKGTRPGNHGRARAVWDRYGLGGLALVSPLVTGVHLATVIALAVGSKKRDVAVWMTVSIALWTVALTAGSYYGFGFVGETV